MGLELWPVIAELRDPLGTTWVCRLLPRVCRPAVVRDGRLPREVLRSCVPPPAGAWAQRDTCGTAWRSVTPQAGRCLE
eukprot:scaffold4545_cov58-Phaeocystis_antarctica.AAC.8